MTPVTYKEMCGGARLRAPIGREERRARESRAERDLRSLMQPAHSAGDEASDEAGEA